MSEITQNMREKRSANIQSQGCDEVECPSCKGHGSHKKKQSRVAGSAMNEHKKHGSDAVCRCPRSTVQVIISCSRCGGYGTVPRQPSKVK